MQNLLNELTELLRHEQAFVSDGVILKNVVVEAAMNMDPRLLRLLQQDDRIRQFFFSEIDGVLVFDKVKFQQFVSNKIFLPDSYTAFKNRIGLTDKRGDYLNQFHDVVLTWPYKDCVLEGGMTHEDQGRDEVFWSTTLAPDDITRLFEPKVFTNWERWDLESVIQGQPTKLAGNIAEDDNLMIKGNNLLALHSLKHRYAGKVKLIYIDPPYNTGNDGFRYNDKFNHSTWLTFMHNRLSVSKRLLRRDGFMLVHCDRNEFAYLKVLMDELMGRDQFVECITVVNNPGGRDYGGVANMHEYILCYSNSSEYKLNRLPDPDRRFDLEDENGEFEPRELRNRNPTFNEDNRPNLVYPFYVDPNDIDDCGLYAVSLEERVGWFKVMPAKSQGIQTVWRWSKSKSQSNLNSNIKAKRMKNGRFQIVEKYRNRDRMARSVWWDKLMVSQNGTLHLKSLLGTQVFAFPKPERTLEHVVEMTTQKGDLILDFFAGSGTTAAVAQKMGRRWILVEQMDYVRDCTKERIKKVIQGEGGGISESVNWIGGGSFVYTELASSNAVFAERVAEVQDVGELIGVYKDVESTGYLRIDVDLASLSTEDFLSLSLEDAKQVLFDCLDANHLYINLNSLGDEDFLISEEDTALTRSFYGVEK